MSWLSKSLKKISKKNKIAAVVLSGDPISATTIGSVLATRGTVDALKNLTKVPIAPGLVETPSVDLDAAAKAAAAAEAERIKKKKGYQSTIVTGQLGISSDATTKKNTLG